MKKQQTFPAASPYGHRAVSYWTRNEMYDFWEDVPVDRCVICGEPIYSDMAEMHDAAKLNDPELYSEAESGLVHAQCGIDRGWEVS